MARHSLQHYVPFIAARPCKTSLLYWPAVYSAFEGDWFISWERGLKKRDQSEIRARSNITQNERDTERDANEVAPFCSQFLHLCMYHQVCMCVCVSSARLCDLSLSFVRTSQQLNAAFCNQFLHLCMYHQVCMCVCVCLRPGCVIWCVRTSQQLNAAFCNQFLPLCMYHQVCMCVCVCVFGQVVWFEFVRTSQQLNAAFCKQFLHLCMHHVIS